MRIRVISITVSVFLCLFKITDAYSSYHNTNLVFDIKPTQFVRSKPTSVFSQTKLIPIRLASVQFLTDGTQLKFDKVKGDVKSQCASLGYVLPVSQCDASKGYMPSYLCSSELPDVTGSGNYTSGCCNSLIYTASSEKGCGDNSTATGDYCYWGSSKKYRCTCDNIRYPYRAYTDAELNAKEGMPCGEGQVFDYTDVCTIKDAGGAVISKHYASCCLPFKEVDGKSNGGYKQCDGNNHEVGWGKSCRINNGATILYEKCVCSTNYQTECESTRLIDGSDYCRLDGTIYTRESNCESTCTYTAETNIDSFLYGKVWHCLFEEAGATIKKEEEQVCGNPKDMENVNYFDDCEAQGYTKSVADCYIDSLILECPSDSSKVWCVDGRACSKYPVGNIGIENACTKGANLIERKDKEAETCFTDDKVVRCRYKKEDCNKCWNDGQYIGNCTNLDNLRDTNNKYLGYSLINGNVTENCCKFGYYMENGICVPNECDNGYYPYAIRPDKAIGEVEECYEADDSASLGYKVYFGYKDCKDDAAQGQYWMHDSSNSRKCVCNRGKPKDGDGNEIPGREALPFNIEDYFNGNGDTNNPGFGEGKYGEYRSCTDPEGSYYGYDMCYIGRKMSESGKCVPYQRVSYNKLYPYYISNVNNQLEIWGYPTVSIKTEPRTSEQAYCVHKYTHCEDKLGKKLGSQDVCDMIPDGCNYGYESACSECYHVSSVVKNGDLFNVNPDYTFKVNRYTNNQHLSGFESCPEGVMHGGNYKVCYGYCDIKINGNYDVETGKYTYVCEGCDKCQEGSILRLNDDNNPIIVGILYANRSSKLYVNILGNYPSADWYSAMEDVKKYAPFGLEMHYLFGVGCWRLPLKDEVLNTFAVSKPSVGPYPIMAINSLHGYSGGGTWTSTEKDSNTAYMQWYTSDMTSYTKSTSQVYTPTIIFEYSGSVDCLTE